MHATPYKGSTCHEVPCNSTPAQLSYIAVGDLYCSWTTHSWNYVTRVTAHCKNSFTRTSKEEPGWFIRWHLINPCGKTTKKKWYWPQVNQAGKQHIPWHIWEGLVAFQASLAKGTEGQCQDSITTTVSWSLQREIKSSHQHTLAEVHPQNPRLGTKTKSTINKPSFTWLPLATKNPFPIYFFADHTSNMCNNKTCKRENELAKQRA